MYRIWLIYTLFIDSLKYTVYDRYNLIYGVTLNTQREQLWGKRIEIIIKMQLFVSLLVPAEWLHLSVSKNEHKEKPKLYKTKQNNNNNNN